MFSNQLKEVAAMAVIGEGVVGILYPGRHLLIWQFGPRAYREFVGELVKHRALMRLMFAAEAGLGLWWAARLVRR